MQRPRIYNPPTPPVKRTPDCYSVILCGEESAGEYSILDKFKEDLQRIVNTIIERIDKLDDRISNLEDTLFEKA